MLGKTSPAGATAADSGGSASPCLSDTQLTALLDGSLATNGAAQLDEHVDQCSSCRALVAKLLQAQDTMSTTTAARSLPRASPHRRDTPPIEPAATLGGQRYLVQALLGAGGMGRVHRALDRLTGRSVALKQVALRSAIQPQLLAALAQEFRTLATLRHPGIISVLDYGFDAQQRPFFTMEFLQDAQPLRRFAESAAKEVRIDLLIQLLHALKYLHRRGIIHGDLKPSNLLVVDAGAAPVLKLLDFGLSYAASEPPQHALAGTLPYMSPELFEGASPSVASDLYAVGVIGCELLAGHPPFRPQGSAADLIQQILRQPPDLSGMSQGLGQVLARVLSKSVDERYSDADSLLHALCSQAGISLPSEPAAARDSYLHAARFVGRQGELATLRQSLAEANAGRGAAWLLAGESGVGKSRLLEELRCTALISGLIVLRGQAQPNTGGAYHIWSDVLPGLALQNEISDLEVSVLGAILPNLGAVLGRRVSPPPEAGVQAARVRLLRVLREVVQRSRRPVVILLEDLQWADGESLDLLLQVSADIITLPLLVIGSYRDDEAPRLPGKLPAMQLLRLPRLDQDTTAALCASMLGNNPHRPALIERIRHETEGNTYFIVEVVRALAAEAGSIEAIGQRGLPERIFAGGIEEVLSRRLARLPDSARALLRLAALAGRQLDLQLLARDTPELDALIQLSTDSGVLEVYEQRFRFSHDKLRERLISELAPSARLALHAELAARFAAEYPESALHAAQIAYHHREAQQAAPAAHYYAIAGDAALSRGAPEEARALLLQALHLHAQLKPTLFCQVRVQRGLAQAEFGLGNYQAADAALRQTFALGGLPLVDGPQPWYGAALKQLIDVAARRLLPPVAKLWPPPPSPQRDVLHELLRVLGVMEIYVWLGRPELYIQCTLWALKLEEILGTVGNHTNSHAALAFLLSYTPLGGLAVQHLLHRGQALVPGSIAELAALRVEALVRINQGRLAEAARKAEVATAIARAHQDDLGLLGCLLPLQVALNMLDDCRAALAVCSEMEQVAARTQNPHYEALALIGQVAALLRLGEHDRVEALAERALAKLPPEFSANPAAFLTGMVAVCASQKGQQERAEKLAATTLLAVKQAKWVLAELRYALMFVLEVYLASAQPEQYAAEIDWALARMQQMTRRSPSTQPFAHMLQGRVYWLRGKHASAHRSLLRGVAEAYRWESQFAQASTQLWLGRFIESQPGQRLQLTGGQTYLKSASAIFARLGFEWEIARVRPLLSPR